MVRSSSSSGGAAEAVRVSGSDVPRPGLAQHPPIMHKRTSTAAPITLDRTLAMCEWLFPAQTLEAGRL